MHHDGSDFASSVQHAYWGGTTLGAQIGREERPHVMVVQFVGRVPGIAASVVAFVQQVHSLGVSVLC
jgi:hypothetical protein